MPELGLADAALAAQHGYRAIRIACLPEPTFAPEYHRPTDTPERLEPAALERAFEFCSQLIKRIDERLVVDPVRADRLQARDVAPLGTQERRNALLQPVGGACCRRQRALALRCERTSCVARTDANFVPILTHLS
jgi:hypothetical protein